ncbi:hypothetical protein ANO14919_040260 [Xylariales sp. No.14919]|nr:hypothetical protein ANO14919_040260 [Xylariales sp. No.14919]
MVKDTFVGTDDGPDRVDCKTGEDGRLAVVYGG